MLPVRQAKDGVLLSETYYLGGGAARIESDSAGKTITALLIGVLATRHRLDLDRPIRDYNVTTTQSWGAPTAASPEGEYWPLVTTRHILAQVSGIGKYAPGTMFTYDSGDQGDRDRGFRGLT